MSQERVLTLLYDKTFPPRSQQEGNIIKQLQGLNLRESQMGSQTMLKPAESLHQFNYYGQMNMTTSGAPMRFYPEVVPEDDLERLENEIEDIIRSGTGKRQADEKVLNMAQKINKNRGRTAGTAVEGARRIRIPKSSSFGGPISIGTYHLPISQQKLTKGFL